ncbi:MAG: hypothetical protein AAGA96_02670 [Verrucomicrobiota bacterium]
MPSTAVKIKADLFEEAREAAATDDRSLTGQIEHWAKLGKSVESILSTPMIAALKKSGGDPEKLTSPEERDQILKAISALREKPRYAETKQFLQGSETPLYETDPNDPTKVVRVEADGTRTPGELVGREFRPE